MWLDWRQIYWVAFIGLSFECLFVLPCQQIFVFLNQNYATVMKKGLLTMSLFLLVKYSCYSSNVEGFCSSLIDLLPKFSLSSDFHLKRNKIYSTAQFY